MNTDGRDNIIKIKTFKFAVRIVRLYQYLCKEKNEYILSKQVLKSGTSVGANVEEAGGGISKIDFSYKISISYKEAKETHYWLRLLKETDYLNDRLFNSLIYDCEEICKILYSILKTTRLNKT